MYRHENKYTAPPDVVSLAESRLRLLPQGVRQTYPPRRVNSLYFDDLEADSYWQTVEGLGRRAKLRLRWYGDFWGEVAEAWLELKLKSGHAGTKRRYPAAPFHLRPDTPRRALAELPRRAPAAGGEAVLPSGLEAVLATRYRRRYYATADRRVRLTLDEDIRYLRPGNRGFSAFWIREPRPVVELKYDVERRREAEAVVRTLGLRWVRNSKFARGLRATAP